MFSLGIFQKVCKGNPRLRIVAFRRFGHLGGLGVRV